MEPQNGYVKRSPKAGRPSKLEREQTRVRILEAAVDLFSEVGYVNATTGDIADRAGITKRTLYRHMGSKDNLLAEVHRQLLDNARSRWEDVVARGNDPVRTFEELIEAHLDVVAEYRRSLRVFLESFKYLSEEAKAEIQDQRNAYLREFVGLMVNGQATGAFRPGDAVVRTMLILSALNSGYDWYDPSERTEDGEPTSTFIAKFLGAGLTGSVSL